MGVFRTLAEAILSAGRWLLGALAWLVSQLVGAVLWFRFLRPELWIVEGEERTSGLPLSILCAVSDQHQNQNYLLQVMFAEGYRRRRLGRYWLWKLARAVPAAGADCALIVVEMGQGHLRFVPWRERFFVPAWVLGVVDFPRDAHAIRKVKGDRKKVRHHGLDFEITRDPEQFEDFYHNMYVPYITQTHGRCADLNPYEHLKAGFRHCDLLLVKQQGKSIAGHLILYEAAGPHLWEVGIRDGNREYVENGAGGAAGFYFGLQYLEDKGYKKAFLGWSRPFLHDGPLKFKRKWSQRICANSFLGFALRVGALTPAAKAFLCNNPFFFLHRDEFYAAVFVDAQRPLSAEQIQEIDREYFHAGLTRLFVYCLGQEGPCSSDGVPAELAERIELRGVQDLLHGGAPIR